LTTSSHSSAAAAWPSIVMLKSLWPMAGALRSSPQPSR
jgi:hypothetical protein